MKKIKELIQESQLSEAIDCITQALKSSPSDATLRSTFIELLCIDGQYERADQQLNLIVKQNPDYLTGANNLRQLLRSAVAREDFSKGKASAVIIRSGDQSSENLLKSRLSYIQEDSEEYLQFIRALEESRVSSAVTVDGVKSTTLRDIDDSLGGYLELFGTDGNYYLVPIDAILSLEFQPVSSLVEIVWRKAVVDIEGGLQGEAFIPMTYLNSLTDQHKLARETEWVEHLASDVFVGQGQKMMLFGDDDLPLSQIKRLEKSTV
ncbi:type VI secretion system accessory protein TagJ [Photobacterium atrarenae]|uniref:Protein of avirulence locus ImpE n=1 Tax=Photobacterium atrarenae TaxID=865757 RepID=A0ABY5GBF9_9GAMM|nr:type VI secretion system accessory protein TagJ [Photobacterium atrarenae]UTV26492.1 protein of avirulence locus ImpE [Photobacterium atrarenae]